MSDARFEDRSEAEIAEMVVDLRTRQGFAADRRTSDGHEFVLAKREDPAESELTWVAGRRTVSDERLERFRNSARQLGADSARVVTVGEGRLAGEAPESVAHTTGAELADRLAAEGLIESAE